MNPIIRFPAFFRFVDSLDSVRFSHEMDFPEIREVHAYSDIFYSLVFFNGILVPENQLMDSPGFLKILNSLIEHARNYNILLPIKAAMRDHSKTPHEITADLFSNIDPDDIKNRFKLSAYPMLDEISWRRKIWADFIRKGDWIPEQLNGKKLIWSDDERELSNALITVLNYLLEIEPMFGRSPADFMPHIFSGEITQIANLSSDNLFNMTKETPDPLFPKIIHDNWIQEEELDQALELVKLVNTMVSDLQPKYKEINRRSIFHNHAKDYSNNESLRKGLLELVDSIYNFNLALSIRADSFNNTTARSIENKYVPTAKALSYWANETTVTTHGYQLDNPGGWIIPNKFEWSKSLTPELIRDAKQSIPFEALISAITKPEWEETWSTYVFEFSQVQSLIKISLSSSDLSSKWTNLLEDSLKSLDQAITNHIEVSSELISNESWQLRKNQFINKEKTNKPTMGIEFQFPIIKLQFQNLEIWEDDTENKEKNRIKGIVIDLLESVREYSIR